MSAATQIDEELRAISEANGILRPIDVVNWASEHPDSALHGSLEWDDSRAGHQYRLHQARNIIRVRITMLDQTPTRSYVSVRSLQQQAGGGYATIQHTMTAEQLRAELLAECRTELNRVRRKYNHLTQLSHIWDSIDQLDAG